VIRRTAGLIARLADAGLTVATAESLTAGLVAATLTEVPGASAVVRGGLVVYATDLKASLAGVDQAVLDRGGPVQAEVAVQLADGARRVCRADVGVGVTGVAGPDPVDGHPPGVWFAAVTAEDLVLTAAGEPVPTVGRDPAGLRTEIRQAVVDAVLGLLDSVARPSRPAGS
jgi:nicotinamide-nucleotide amidase